MDRKKITLPVPSTGTGKTYRHKTNSVKVKDIKLYDPKKNRPRPSKDDISFSEDVFIIDENGMHGLAYFDFELDHWTFHTDTLVDYEEVGAKTKWKWYYPPIVDHEKLFFKSSERKIDEK